MGTPAARIFIGAHGYISMILELSLGHRPHPPVAQLDQVPQQLSPGLLGITSPPQALLSRGPVSAAVDALAVPGAPESVLGASSRSTAMAWQAVEIHLTTHPGTGTAAVMFLAIPSGDQTVVHGSNFQVWGPRCWSRTWRRTAPFGSFFSHPLFTPFFNPQPIEIAKFSPGRVRKGENR